MTTHSHGCDVPGCRETMPCSGYQVAHEGGSHCVEKEWPAIWLCDEHQLWRPCPWCGQWYDYEHTILTDPPACSQACADQMQPPSAAKEHTA